ncbi:MAG: hypothetical protein EOP88_17100 [Verrucomicrobiaceae bacterium]|nr:MAG: hypothetical protein EOP88_17100 [Verrucomicrobiaceae bacterium]
MAEKKSRKVKTQEDGRKVHSNSVLKNLPREDQEVLWELYHPSDKDTPAYSVEQCLVHVLEQHGKLVKSPDTFYKWHDWYSLERRLDSAAERAEQARLELAKDPTITPEDLDRVAQTVFMAESLQSGNAKVYVALAKLNLAKNKQQLDRDKLTAATKSQLERGLDALLAEIQGNPKALAIFTQLQEVVSKA